MSAEIENIWLPYTQHQLAPNPPKIVDASGCKLILEDGNELIDGVSNWWTACHGHKHPHLVEEVKKQIDTLPHAMFGGLVHDPAIKLSERLAKLTKLPKVFFSDSGSTAVEVALKMAVQFWKNKNKNSKKVKFLHFNHSYHGDTMGAMSVSDSGFDKPYQGHYPMQFKFRIPRGEMGMGELEQILSETHKQLAGVIIEPLVQCAGGLKFHSPDMLEQIYKTVKQYDLLFIADEVATGFGRTGYMFACEEAGIEPDIMCVGKALTGGMMTMGATCASEEVFDGFKSERLRNAFMHGPTFMGNPTACAAANASIDLFEQNNYLEDVAKIEEQLREELEPCRELEIVKDVRVKGAIGVVEIRKDRIFYELREKFLKKNVWIRPFDNLVYITPPYVISEKELTTLTSAIFEVLKEQK